MNDIVLKVGIPILTALLAFLGAVYKGKIDLKKQEELNNMELQKVREQCTNEIDKIKTQLDKQAELYEKNAQTDIAKEFMSSVIHDPIAATKKIEAIMTFANKVNMLKSKE